MATSKLPVHKTQKRHIERNAEIFALLDMGFNDAEIGRMYDLPRQRISEIKTYTFRERDAEKAVKYVELITKAYKSGVSIDRIIKLVPRLEKWEILDVLSKYEEYRYRLRNGLVKNMTAQNIIEEHGPDTMALSPDDFPEPHMENAR